MDRSVERTYVINTMEKHGGSFVQALAVAFRRADSDNFMKLISVFEDKWNEYASLYKQMHIRNHRGYTIKWHGGTEYEWTDDSYCGGTDEHPGHFGWGESFEECIKAIDERIDE